MLSNKFDKKYDRWYAAVVTPFKENYEVDEEALRKLLRYLMQPKFVNAGGGIIINPEAGEIFYLSRNEKRRNVEIVMEECGGKVPIFAGVADLRTEESVKIASDIKEVGADGLFLIPPIGAAAVTIFWEPELYPEVWIDMAKAQVAAADLPVITHPAGAFHPFWGGGLSAEVTIKMCKAIPNIVGWKMLYSHDAYVMITNALRSLDRHVAVLGAASSLFHASLASGAIDGCVTGALCYAMEPTMDHVDAWKRKDIDAARQIWNSGLADLNNYVYIPMKRFHTKYKIATWLRGLIPNPFQRPPMPRPRQNEVLALQKCLTKCGLTVIPEQEIKRVTTQLLP